MSLLIEENRSFLEELSAASTVKRRQLLNSATDGQIHSISEVLQNYDKLPQTASEQKSLKKFKKAVNDILKNPKKSVNLAKRKLIKYQKFLPSIILFTLGKLIQSVVCLIQANT
jgi:Four helix bundle sensory module for signal transduction